jgi:quercetin dioxygenase-like cupin family protein
MNQVDFERELKQQGYGEMVDRHMEADKFNPEHAHDFDAYVLVLDGEMTITCDGSLRTLRAGDTCAMSAGTLHTEQCGPAGARYLAGRRYGQQAAS